MFLQTAMPNWLHQASQDKAEALFKEKDWSHVSDICSVDMLHFVCSLLVPKCQTSENSTEVMVLK